MVIPPDLPRFVAAARPGALQALALQSGQLLEAKVVGPAANGGTQVEIRGQVLNLVLPTLVQAGEIIRLEVQGAGQQMRLALQQATAPLSQATNSPAPAAPAPQINLPLPTNPTTNTAPAPSQAGTPPAPAQVVQGQQTVMLPQAAVAETPTSTPGQQTAPSANVAASTAPGSPLSAQATSPAAQPASTSPTPPGTPAAGAQVPTSATVATTTVVTTAVTAPTPAAIYPQANPAQPNPLAVAAAATVATSPAPPTATAVPGAVRPVTPAIAVGGASAHAASGNPLPQPPPQQPATPQAALAQMVHTSIPSQGSVTALTTALASIAGKVVLPEPVVRAAQRVLAGRVAIDAPRFDGAALQAAIRGSGVFQEASLAQGLTQPQADMKAALLTLRQTLTSWLGQQAPVAAIAQLPPPLRGITPRARANEAPPIDPDATPEQVGKQLLERTESALARVRLHQHASLPDPVAKTAEWSMDLPVMVGTQQALMQLHIHGDPQGESETAGERGWQMRFALSLPDMGEVGAQVTLRAGATGVMLWATEPSASAALEAEIASLRETLGQAGLRPGAVIVRHGEPPAPVTPARSGHFVDAQS